MIFSGLILTFLMKKQSKSESQQHWLQKNSLKFYLSILLTPFIDKVAMLLLGEQSAFDEEIHLPTEVDNTLKLGRFFVIVTIYAISV